MRGRDGFTIIELLATSTIIAVVAAITLPGIREAKISANESTAITTIRAFSLATETYRVRYGQFPRNLVELSEAGIIDESLETLELGEAKSGYQYSFIGTEHYWSISANPVTPGETGSRYFFADGSGVIRYDEGNPADGTSPPVDG